MCSVIPIIMDQAEISSIPEINAKHVDAQIVHEAAIGRINDEQLVKLRTFGTVSYTHLTLPTN